MQAKKLRILAKLIITIITLSLTISILTSSYASIDKVRIGVFGMS